ncbi:MAG: hypothetical protein AMS18_02885 [Gemmatimonas sp. SG8_17]|nr:MAG: hypothetical protein AMS18_02885 [Gemmatimonas sp. SG8_17]
MKVQSSGHRFGLTSARMPNSSESPGSLDELLLPGRLVLSDDGRLGRIRRLIVEDSAGPFPVRLEVEGLDGTRCILIANEVRFVYPCEGELPQTAA